MSVEPTALPAFTLLRGDPPPAMRPVSSLVASARRLTSEKMKGRRGATSTSQTWQDDAWDIFDLVGEHRFLATTLANRLGQAHLYVGKVDPEQPNDDPTPLDDESDPGGGVRALLDGFGGSLAGRTQIMVRLGVNLFIAGDGWVVGIPTSLLPSETDTQPGGASPADDTADTEAPLDPLLGDLDWRMLSVSEVASSSSAGKVTLRIGEDDKDKIEVDPDDVWLIRVWKPHPRKAWEADSPTRASLPVLRELVGLTMHVGAQVDSRLAGAGLLIVPQSAARVLREALGIEAVDEDDSDPFTDALIEAMVKPINDRSSASAVVPLVITVPDEAVGLFKHLTFSTPLDATAGALREEAIRRLALGLDAPPELLLGTAGMNHWGAWLVQEEVVNTHLEPPLALICDALTTQYLWPMLEARGMDPDAAQGYVIWYDVEHMIIRPNRAADAKDVHAAGAISDEALRDATGFDEEDAPRAAAAVDEAVTVALDLVRAAPSLAATPGLQALVDQVRAVMTPAAPSAGPVPAPAPAAPAPSGAGTTPAPVPATTPGSNGVPSQSPPPVPAPV